jgi:hypothetical protein
LKGWGDPQGLRVAWSFEQAQGCLGDLGGGAVRLLGDDLAQGPFVAAAARLRWESRLLFFCLPQRSPDWLYRAPPPCRSRHPRRRYRASSRSGWFAMSGDVAGDGRTIVAPTAIIDAMMTTTNGGSVTGIGTALATTAHVMRAVTVGIVAGIATTIDTGTKATLPRASVGVIGVMGNPAAGVALIRWVPRR